MYLFTCATWRGTRTCIRGTRHLSFDPHRQGPGRDQRAGRIGAQHPLPEVPLIGLGTALLLLFGLAFAPIARRHSHSGW